MLIVISAVAVVLFLLTILLRHGIPPDRRLMDNAVPLARRLLPALEDGTEAEIRAAVGGPAGLREIRRTIRSFGAYAKRVKREYPDATKLVFASWLAFLVFGWAAWMETKLSSLLPMASIICTESLARHFCSMCATVDAIRSMLDYV